MKLNKFAVKAVSVLVAIMLVSSQNVFASGRYMNVTEDYTTEDTPFYEEYEENDGSGGVFLVESPVTLTIGIDAIFSDNSASEFGGAINLNNSDATVNIGADSVFESNIATYGGAINIDEGTMTIGAGAYFSNNSTYTESEGESSGGGGAIYNGGGCNLTIGDHAGFYGNHINAEESHGGAIDNYGNITIGNYVEFEENKSENSDGGAIFNYEGTVNIGLAKFSGNTAGKSGGAIYNSGNFTIDDSTAQTKNSPALSESVQKIKVDPVSYGTTFAFNSATNGGAVYNTGSDAVFTIKNKFDFAGFGYNTATTNGGAIFNYEGTVNIDDNIMFEGNLASTYGSAIFNNIGTVNIGNNVYFHKNGIDDSGDTVKKGTGAIYNTSSETDDGVITIGSGAIFEENYSTSLGGAIYNKGEITIGDSSVFKNNSASGPGGAIENYTNGTTTIGSNAQFQGNSSNAIGGAIDNYGTMVIEKNAKFLDNTASGGPGGAIYNGGIMSIGSNALFEGNQGSGGAGAIYNYNSGAMTIGDGSIFRNNTSGGGPGGAINNNNGELTIGSNALFEGNKSGSVGGAMQNYAGKVTIGKNSVFKNNFASSPGGAIYNSEGQLIIGPNALFQNNRSNTTGGAINEGNVTIEDGAKFIGNIANYPGGAYYGQGTINLIAKTNNVEFTGNKHWIGDAKEDFNAIYSYNSGQVNMWASNKADIIFNDPIQGSGKININKPVENYQENKGTGKIVLNADMSKYAGTVNFYGGTIELGKNGTLFGSNNGIKNIDVDNATIKMANGKTANAEFGREGSINIRKELNVTVDADLENKAMDMALFAVGSIGSGKVNVEEINIIKDSDKTTRVDFSAVPEGKVITVNKARSVLYSYDAKLDYGKIEFDVNNGEHYSDVDGYYYTFTKKGFNPVTAAGAISVSVGGYATQSVVMGQAFASMDRQVAAKNQPTVAPKAATKQAETKPATKATNSKTTTNNTQNKKEDKKQAPKKDTKQQNKKTSYIQSSNLYVSAGDQVFAEPSKIERGAWLRPFILNETVKVGDTDVDNNLYGTLAGIDLPVKGDILASFYLGYAGSKQKAEEVKSNQTGYVLGATGMLIKDKWYAGLTLNMIFNKASVDTDDGTNDIDMNMFTIGAKAGYNYDIGKNWILEPNVTLMYGIVNCGSYETTLTKVDSQSVNNIMLEPQVKARWQLINGWQPYGLLGYAANLSSKPTVKTEAGDLDLDSIGGYVEFGAGVNKDFLNTAWSCYAQITGRAAGRSGFEGNFGIKYKF